MVAHAFGSAGWQDILILCVPTWTQDGKYKGGNHMKFAGKSISHGLAAVCMASLLSACATGGSTATSSAPNTTVNLPSGDPGMLEVERRMLAERLRAQTNLRLLHMTLKVRIDQAVNSKQVFEQIRSRVKAGIGRGVDLETAFIDTTSAAIAWRNAHHDSYEAQQSFLAVHGDGAIRGRARLPIILPKSASELMTTVEPGLRQSVKQIWRNRQMSIDLAELADQRALSSEKVRDAYRQQFELGQRSLLDVLGAEQALTDARLSLLRIEVQQELLEVDLLELMGRLTEIYSPAATAPDLPSIDFEQDVKNIEKDIEARAQATSVSAVEKQALAFDFSVVPLDVDPLSVLPPTSVGVPTSPTVLPEEIVGVEDQLSPPSVIENPRRVVSVKGQAILRRADGQMGRLKAGDSVASTDEVVAWPETAIEYEIPSEPREQILTDLPPTAAGLEGGDPGSPMKVDSSNNNCDASLSAAVRLPKLQWPPWPPTDEYGIDAGARKTMGEVADFLSGALDRIEYVNHYAFAAVPAADGAPVGGFALITEPEQILPDGRAVPASGRWQSRLPRAGEVDLLTFIRGLILAPAGRYRVIVFVVTDAPRNRAATALVNDRPLRALARCGPTKLTDASTEMRSLRARAITSETDVRALVYEFSKRAEQQPAQFVKPGLDARKHLEQAGIMTALVSR
jgi:hypothetical protein